MKVTPFEVYQTYLSFKNHFTREKYDYFKYSGKTNASITAFNKRRDKYFFEKMSRQKSDDEVKYYFLSNFVSNDPQKLWIKEIIANGEDNFIVWRKKFESLRYSFEQEIRNVFEGKNFDSFFISEKNRHPQIIRYYFGNKISIETLIIMDKILHFRKSFDKKIDDPVWKTVSFLMRKYEPFINIDVHKYKKILKKVVITNG